MICNQCEEDMIIFNEIFIEIYQGVCCNPKCPNFGLVQIPKESIKKLEEY
jgi:hypothetical protein